jgi:aromatic ring-opening dioxygenase catalytic subunit (LigB family)
MESLKNTHKTEMDKLVSDFDEKLKDDIKQHEVNVDPAVNMTQHSHVLLRSPPHP